MIECNHPRCTLPALTMVEGRYWPLCWDHAHQYLTERLSKLTVEAEALGRVPRPGQLKLVEP